jgi:hypothetical protein
VHFINHEDQAMHTQISRRAPVADAELLDLGAQLEPIIQEWHAKQASDAAESASFEAKAELAGLPNLPQHAEKRASLMHLTKFGWEDSDEHGRDVVWTSIHDRMYPLVDAILSRGAQTVAGLAVQARAATAARADLWEEAEDTYERTFMDAVCEFLNVTPVPLECVEKAQRWLSASARLSRERRLLRGRLPG